VDPTIDLASQWADYHSREIDERTVQERVGSSVAEQVIATLNRHGGLIVKPKGTKGAVSETFTRYVGYVLHIPRTLTLLALV